MTDKTKKIGNRKMGDNRKNEINDIINKLIIKLRYKYVVRTRIKTITTEYETRATKTIYEIVDTHSSSVLNDDEIIEWAARLNCDTIRLENGFKEIGISFVERHRKQVEYNKIRSNEYRKNRNQVKTQWDHYFEDVARQFLENETE